MLTRLEMDLRIYSTCKLCISIGLFISSVAASPPFRTKHVKEGYNVSLDCVGENITSGNVFWTKVDSDTFYTAGPRLQISGISRNDSGNYTCHVADLATNRTVVTVYIDVQYPADITSFSVVPAKPMENQTVTVTCSITGNPEPSWAIYTDVPVYRSNRSGVGTVAFPFGNCGYGWLILCGGSNKLNGSRPVGNSTIVTTSCPPRSDPYHPTDHTHVVPLGGSAYFKENVISMPRPNFTWSRDDGKPVRKSHEHSKLLYATITIHDLTGSDFGNYTLTVANSLGNYTTVFQLIRNVTSTSTAATYVVSSISSVIVLLTAAIVTRHLLT